MNQLEEQLRSWTPRRPSPRLERCGRTAAAAPWRPEQNRPRRSWVLGGIDWPGRSGLRLARTVAPALACLLLTAAILRQPDQGLISPGPDQPALIALAMSNQNFAPYLPGSFQPTANRLDTFGWTNGSGSPSSMRSLTPRKAIYLQ